MKKFNLLAVIIALTVVSCKKETKNAPPIADFVVNDEISLFSLKSNATDANGNTLKYHWSISSDTIAIEGSSSSSAYISLPILTESKPLKVTLEVSNGAASTTVVKEITLPKNTYFRTYGLGKDLSKSFSNDRNYPWYATQYNTGIYANDNCGPTLVTMAVKWIRQDFDQTPEQARALYRPTGGWWNTNDIISYLNRYNVGNKTISLPNMDVIQPQIENGNLIILCLDHFYIRKETNTSWHIDKYYNSSGVGAGHFIIIKGYKVVDGQVFYEAYDPGGQGNIYGNGIYKGRDRYYRAEDLANATVNWWKYAIVVSKGSLNEILGVDVSKIVHQTGN